MNLTVSYKDLRGRVQELESQFLSMDLEVAISTDDLKRLQRDTLQYFDLNGLSMATFGGYELVRQLNFSPLQPSGLGAEKKLIDRLYRNLRTLSNELDRAEALIRKDDPAQFPHSSSSPIPVFLTRERKRSQRARLPHRPVNTSPKTMEQPKPEERPRDPQGERLGHDQKPIRQKLADGRLALGEVINTLYDELKRLKQFARGRRKTEGTLRQQFPDFQLWKEINASSSLSATERKKFFQQTWGSQGQPEMMKFIGRIVAYEASSAYTIWKEYNDHTGTKRKRRSQTIPTDRPKPRP